MSTIINDYSQFYAGTEQLKSYGSNSTMKKDTLVKYRFNTTDENGNKVMDKMSKEEMFQAMKDISSQYGDNVIVQFSGDGMAALADSKKIMSGREMTAEEAAAKEARDAAFQAEITQLEGTYRIVPEDELNTQLNWHETLKEKAPDICNEFDDLMQQILDHALNHNDDGEKFGEKFIELVKKAEQAISAYDAKMESDKKTKADGVDSSKQSSSQLDGIRTASDIIREHSPETDEKIRGFVRDFLHTQDKSYMMKASKLALDWLHENYPKHPDWFGEKSSKTSTKTESAEKSTSTISIGEAGLSQRAQAFLKKLRETYGNMDFFVADFNKGDNAKDILSGATKEFSVILSSEELEKMAADEKYADEYMARVQGAVRMSERINQEFGFTSAFGENANGAKISKIAISFNQDGTTSIFAELEKSSQQQRERIEKAREEKRAEKKEHERRAEREKQAERTTVQANSIEELIEKINKVDWTKVTEEYRKS